METENKLDHLAIIMDGNRRWAKLNNKTTKEGHKAGAEKLVEVVKWCIELDIKYLTVYAFSTENWKRDETEINDIMFLLKEFLSSKVEDFKKENIKLKVIGSEEKVDKDIINKVREIEKSTLNNTKLQLNIAFNYGGRQEIVDIAKNIAKDILSSKIKVENITEDVLKKYLYYGDIPDPDILIRTGSDARISNFLLWEVAYSELYFTDEFWPDFTKNTLVNIINNFKKKERRYGGTITK